MSLPIERLSENYALLGQTIDSALKRLAAPGARNDEESLVLQGAYLFGVRAFEYFLEGQIIHLCHPQSTWGPKFIGGKSRRFVRKLSDKNSDRVKSILTINGGYATYLPYEQSVKKAKVLFARGRPFSLLESRHSEVITRAHVVRNLIAHDSDYAMKQFQKTICSRYPLRPELRNATGYLKYESILGQPMVKQDLAGLYEAAAFLS